MRAFSRTAKMRILLGALAAATGLILVWSFFGGGQDDGPTADIVLDLKRLETEEASEQSGEILAVHQEALAVVRQLLDRYPASPEALDAVAWTLLQLGRPDEARKCWQRSIAMAPDFGDGYFWLGQIAQDAGDNAEAARRFRQAIDHRTTNRAAPTLLAKSLENLGRFAEAASLLEAEAQANPNYPGVLVVLGQVYLKSKDYAKAKDSLEKALAADPLVPRGNFALATAYDRLGDQAKAKQCMEKAKEESRKEEMDHRQALKTGDDIQAARKDLAGVYVAAGKVYLGEGDAHHAEAHLRRATEIAPHLTESRLILAWAFRRQGRLEDALAVLSDAAKTQFAGPDVYLQLGEIAASLQRFDVAEQALRDAIRVSPRSAFARATLAGLYLLTGRDLVAAKSLARQAVDLEPNARNLYVLACAFRAGGDRMAALAAIDRAVAIEPENMQYRGFRESIARGP